MWHRPRSVVSCFGVASVAPYRILFQHGMGRASRFASLIMRSFTCVIVYCAFQRGIGRAFRVTFTHVLVSGGDAVLRNVSRVCFCFCFRVGFVHALLLFYFRYQSQPVLEFCSCRGIGRARHNIWRNISLRGIGRARFVLI